MYGNKACPGKVYGWPCIVGSINGNLQEPKNNDGREFCFWCKSPTKEVVIIVERYHICTKCGR